MDNERVKPVRRLVLHHSLGPEFKYFDELTIMDWFDNCGKGWGYAHYCKKYGIDINTFHTGHMHPARDKETFAQAHFALAETRKGWKLVPLMRDPYNCVALHADQYLGATFNIGEVNKDSIGVEVCGDYSHKTLPEQALKVLVAGFIDPARSATKQGFPWLIEGHCDHASTTCPGLIYTQLPQLRQMFAEGLA